MKEIQADIRSGELKPCYLIFGEEAYVRRSLRDRLRKAVIGDDTENNMNYTFLEGKEAVPDAIIEMGETTPFFADRRLILVENSGFFKKEPERLTDWLDTMSDTTCLVFVEEAVDKRNRLYKKVSKLGHAAECKRQSEAELQRWVVRGFGQAGKKIQGSGLEEFLRRTGDDMENIRQEMEKLIGYTGEREGITLEDVEVMTTPQLNDRIFDMIDAIAVRNQRKALTLYYDLLQLKEPPMKILVLIARQFHGILQVKELRENGMSKDQIAERTGLRPFVVSRYMGQASRFRREELERYVAMSVETDEAVKQGNLKDSLAAEMMIIEFSKA